MGAFTDVLNRGTIAGALGAPVDITDMLIKGLRSGANTLGANIPELPEKPVGGSEWIGQKMQDLGVVSPTRRPLAETAASFIGPGEIAAAGKGALALKAAAPLIAGLRAGEGASEAAKVARVAEDVAPAAQAAEAAAPAAQEVAKTLSPQARVAGERRMLREALPEGADPKQYLSRPTVTDPQRVSFPGIYKRPDELVAGARVAPEDPLMKQLFGVTRGDLFDIAQQGQREGNILERPFVAPEKGRGSAAAQQVMNPRNEQRILDIIDEARKRPDLYQGMVPWYVMDPAYHHFVRLYGPERAAQEYQRFNTLTGMASPGSEVLTELNRGSAANWLDKQGRFDDFLRYGGGTAAGTPEDMAAVMGHAYHKTAQAVPMERFLRSGQLEMGSAKVPSYIAASGVPETGFQTRWPVGDAHWSRLVGLPDVRGTATRRGVEVIPGASASVPEMTTLGPWWRDRIARQAGMESVPAQALVWGAGSNATGVTSPIGAPKLELVSQQIGKAAKRMGVSPEEARDRIFLGQAHAGFADPMLLGGIAAGGGGAYALGQNDDVRAQARRLVQALRGDNESQQ